MSYRSGDDAPVVGTTYGHVGFGNFLYNESNVGPRSLIWCRSGKFGEFVAFMIHSG